MCYYSMLFTLEFGKVTFRCSVSITLKYCYSVQANAKKMACISAMMHRS